MSQLEQLPNANQKIKFFSLKWKSLIAISLILIMINGFITLITYNSLNHQFISQQKQLLSQQKSESDKLIKQVFQRLENFSQLIPLFSSKHSNMNSIKRSIDEHWEHIQLSYELRTAQLMTETKENIGHWGNELVIPIDILLTKVLENKMPIKAFLCRLDCNFLLASPIRDEQGNTFVLVVSHPVTDWLVQLKSSTGADVGIVSTRQDFPNHPSAIVGERILPNWKSDIIGLTDPDKNFQYLQDLSNQITIENARLQNNYLTKNAKDLNILFISLDTEDSNNPDYLVLINDITANRKQVKSGVSQAIIIAIIGVLVTAIFILLAMWYPIRHLTILSKTLPLLATGHFIQAKKYLSENTISTGSKDELDLLDDTAAELTNQLERLHDEVKVREKALTQNALYDGLTNLANRQLFMERISLSLSELKRGGNKFAVLFLDLDQFKRINDSLGHEQGDQLLIEVAKRLLDCVRQSDTVARIGGDEFTILVKNLEDTYHATNIALKVLDNLKTPTILKGREIIVTTSIGVAIAPENGSDPETILRNADLAMYKAKGTGRDNYHYYTISMNTEAQELLALENELRYAVDNNEFELYYQPQIDLETGLIIGAEALLRWNSSQRGFVAPYVFIEALEDTGLIVPLGEQILRMACEQAQQWSQLDISKIKVAVNLSARQFKDPKLIDCITSILKNKNLDSRFLELEITESMLIDDIQNTIKTLNQLKRLGLTLSIDDFGTGYSSLSYLKKFPVNILKVDREFVKDIPNNQSDMAISSAVIAMAHKLNLKVVAEGIETEEQVNFLKQNNCEIGQGYYFGKPMPVAEMTALLTKNQVFEIK